MKYNKYLYLFFLFFSLYAFSNRSFLNEGEKLHLIKLVETLSEKQEKINERKGNIETVKDKDILYAEEAKLRSDEEAFENKFSEFIQFITQVDLKELNSEQKISSQNFMSEFQEVLEPVLFSLKKMSEHPRKIEKDRRKIEATKEKIKIIDQGFSQIEELMNNPDEESFKPYLLLAKKRLDAKKGELSNKLAIQERHLTFELENHKGFKENFLEMVDLFFSQKGRNFVLALLIFLGIWSLLSFLLKPLSFFFKKKLNQDIFLSTTFFSRPVVPIFWGIFSSLLFLYIVEDWFLLVSFFLLMWLFGASLKRVGSDFLKKLEFFMNRSGVKEGERLIWKGIPFLVEKIGIFSRLVNPKLQGGAMMIHYEQLLTMNSRPSFPEEEWFPSVVGDVVLLDNGAMGKVLFQSPEFIQLELLNLHKKTFTIAKYLEFAPLNFSRGFFVSATMGVLCEKFDELLAVIPQKIREEVMSVFFEEFSNHQMMSLDVSFESFMALKASFVVRISCQGNMAIQYSEYGKKLKEALLKLAEKEKWSLQHLN